MVDRYGDAIEWDLHERSLDLLDFFRGKHSWRKLANLLERLPMSSAFREAMLDDPEVAEELAKQPEAKEPGRPRLSEFDTHTALLTDILDRLGDVFAAVIVTSGGRQPKVKPAPRPLTGVARFREQAARQKHLALVAEVEAARERERKGGV
jgi:hypothetical protein